MKTSLCMVAIIFVSLLLSETGVSANSKCTIAYQCIHGECFKSCGTNNMWWCYGGVTERKSCTKYEDCAQYACQDCFWPTKSRQCYMMGGK